MVENNFQLSGTVGSNIEWDFGSKLVIQIAKDLEPEEKLILNKLRFRCDQLCFNIIIQVHGYSDLPREDFTSANIGLGDECPKHTLVSNSSGTAQKGWISIYFHAVTPEIPLNGPQKLYSADGIWCNFAIEKNCPPVTGSNFNMLKS